jgi:hypothetical protein
MPELTSWKSLVTGDDSVVCITIYMLVTQKLTNRRHVIYYYYYYYYNDEKVRETCKPDTIKLS